ncbi:hypothetical protein FOA52_011693 [Chlamydomonas sp. UWO 241]|nr:hypothetical protein FOA52_011693 [Chlamydomonas sp. UWO 241]
MTHVNTARLLLSLLALVENLWSTSARNEPEALSSFQLGNAPLLVQHQRTLLAASFTQWATSVVDYSSVAAGACATGTGCWGPDSVRLGCAPLHSHSSTTAQGGLWRGLWRGLSGLLGLGRRQARLAGDWSARRGANACNVLYRDPNALWFGSGSNQQYITVEFATPVFLEQIIVVETGLLGCVESFALIATNGTVNIVTLVSGSPQADDTRCIPYKNRFTRTVAGGVTSYLVKGFKVRMNASVCVFVCVCVRVCLCGEWL